MPLKIKSSGSYYATFDDSALTTDRIYTLPNISGSLLTSNSTGSFPFSASYAVSASYVIGGGGGGGGASYPTQTAYKTANQTTYTYSGTFSYDNHLSISVTTAGFYAFDLDVVFVSDGGTTRFEVNGATSGYGSGTGQTGGGQNIISTYVGNYNTNNQISFHKMSGIAELGANATFKVGYYAYNNGNVTLYKGCSFRIYKLD